MRRTGLAELADDLLEQARPFGGEFGAPAALLVAETHRATGDIAHAREGIDAFAELTEASPNFRALFAPIAARALVALGDVDTAERLIPDHSDARTKRHRVSLLTARAVVAEARGTYPVALDGYKLAIALWRTHGFQLELGLTRIGAARCLLELDRWDEAADSLAAARDVLLPLRRDAVPGRDRRAPRRRPRAPARFDRRLTSGPGGRNTQVAVAASA